MHRYYINTSITITEMSETDPQVTIDETVWHMALRVIKSFNVTRESNRVTTIGFLKSCYPEMDSNTSRIVVDAAIYAVDNAIYTPEHL